MSKAKRDDMSLPLLKTGFLKIVFVLVVGLCGSLSAAYMLISMRSVKIIPPEALAATAQYLYKNPQLPRYTQDLQVDIELMGSFSGEEPKHEVCAAYRDQLDLYSPSFSYITVDGVALEYRTTPYSYGSEAFSHPTHYYCIDLTLLDPGLRLVELHLIGWLGEELTVYQVAMMIE